MSLIIYILFSSVSFGESFQVGESWDYFVFPFFLRRKSTFHSTANKREWNKQQESESWFFFHQPCKPFTPFADLPCHYTLIIINNISSKSVPSNCWMEGCLLETQQNLRSKFQVLRVASWIGGDVLIDFPSVEFTFGQSPNQQSAKVLGWVRCMWNGENSQEESHLDNHLLKVIFNRPSEANTLSLLHSSKCTWEAPFRNHYTNTLY